MQEKYKHEDIMHIQNTFWSIYKIFTERDHNSEEWCDRAAALVSECEDEMEWFCKNLMASWKPVIDGLATDFQSGADVKKKTECIKNIQNALWSLYKGFLDNHSVKEYTDRAAALVHEYRDKKDMMLFAQTLVLSWTPVISRLKEEFRKGDGNAT